VTPVSAAAGRAGPRVPACPAPTSAAVTPDSRTVYVACAPWKNIPRRLGFLPGSVTPITTATSKPGRAITAGRGPIAMIIAR
jgi:hypothetical protein